MPDVPVATEAKNAPATVTVPVIENDAGEAELSIIDGSAVEAVPKVTDLRLPV
jgi:hypothetical protein